MIGRWLAWFLVGLWVIGARPAAALPSPWQWRTIVGVGFAHVPPAETTWLALAERFDVSPRHLALAHGSDPLDPVPAGTRLWISDQRFQPWRPDSGGLINLPEGRFDLVLDGIHVGSWPVAIGTRDWPTPLGRFPLQQPVWQPTWYVPESMRAAAARQGRTLPRQVPPGPANPLGEVWMGLGPGRIGLHGTPADTRWAELAGSHGCLRLAPAHARAVASLWRPGLMVDIVYERAKLGRHDGHQYLEVHPDPYQRQPRPPASWARTLPKAVLDRIWQRACGLPLKLPLD